MAVVEFEPAVARGSRAEDTSELFADLGLPAHGARLGALRHGARLGALRHGAPHGVLGDLAVMVTAAVTALSTGLSGSPLAVLLAVIVVWRVYSFAAQPAFERGLSFTPVIRLTQGLSAAAVTVVVLGVADQPAVHQSAIVLVVVAAVAMASTAVRRAVLSRTPTVLVGSSDQVNQLQLQWAGRRDVDVVETYRWAGSRDLTDQRSGVVADVLAAVARHGATSVVVAGGSSLSSPTVSHLAWSLQRAQVECLVVPELSGHADVVRLRRIGDQMALSLRARNDHLAMALVKSAIDRIGAVVGLIVLSPLLLIIAAAVRWDSHGPAVFSQVRTGRGGQPFRMYKFRSMVIDAESRLGDLLDRNEATGPLFKIAQDPRITRLGRFLRRSSLDELLQLVNVAKGEMSLVGPRPALPSETATYDPWTWRRLHVKPGVTGLWQVSGRSTLTWEESVRKDLEYVNTQSLRLDLSILVRTVSAVLRREGAH